MFDERELELRYKFIINISDIFQIKKNGNHKIGIAGRIQRGELIESLENIKVKILNKQGKILVESEIIEITLGFDHRSKKPRHFLKGMNVLAVFSSESEEYLEINGYIVI